mmetsp:Transcript_596/g.929  ORF Transcript_596/g.929 Transcript_596/m.929 type:complete len:411 (-) Transcript_596:64-1296(-)
MLHRLTQIMVLVTITPSFALDNGLGRTPAMGYNTWYDLMGSLTEENLKASVDAFIKLGLPELGYTYFNLDDDWAAGRYPNGTVFADESKFPSKTLKPIADYVHSNGLKFGTYTDRGTLTCGGKPGSFNYEKIDARTYALWGVDYLKEDSCHASSEDHDLAFQEYTTMRDALNATGRPILFSLCGWYSWYALVGSSLGNSWRIGPDDTNWDGVLTNININSRLAQHASPGSFNDPCLLLSTNFNNYLRITLLQSRAQFIMWCIMASPLLISGNVRNLDLYVVDTYKNKDAIAINQDPLGKQGIRVRGSDLTVGSSKGDDTNVWMKELESGIAVAFLNVGASNATVQCDAACFAFSKMNTKMLCGKEVYSGIEVKFATADGLFVLDLPPSGGSALFKLSACRGESLTSVFQL